MRDEAFPVEPYLVASALRGAVAQRLIETLCPHCKVERKLLQEESDLLDLPPDTIIYDINPHGCEHCKHRGINGRTAVFEIADFRKVDRWEELVHQRVSNSEYRKACIDSGMVTLFEAAKRKLVEGSVYPKSVYDTFGFLAFGEQVQEKLRKKH
jgi:type II secretory ATPase GspE/PulE/Tfp pilus assembly ATPase PilB-like protein